MTAYFFRVRDFALVDVLTIRSLISLVASASVLVRSAWLWLTGRVTGTWTGEARAVSIQALSRGDFVFAELSVKTVRTKAVVAAVGKARSAVGALAFVLIRQGKR